MTVNDKNHKLSFEVVDYSWDDYSESDNKEFDYDANWLIIQVKYMQNGIWLEDTDACLLTSELAKLHKATFSIWTLISGCTGDE